MEYRHIYIYIYIRLKIKPNSVRIRLYIYILKFLKFYDTYEGKKIIQNKKDKKGGTIFKWIRVKFLIYHYIYHLISFTLLYIYILIRNESLKKGKGTNIQIFLNVLDALEFSDNIVIVFPVTAQ